jgi:hypothetical protein
MSSSQFIVVAFAFSLFAIVYNAASRKRRSFVPSHIVATVGMMLFLFGMKDSSWLLIVLGIGGLAGSGVVFFAMGGHKKV